MFRTLLMRLRAQGVHVGSNDFVGDITLEKRVAQLMNDDEINTEYKEAFRQQTVIGWEYIFTGKFAKG